MSYFYIVVFLVGVFYTVVSIVISGVSGAFHAGGDIGAHVAGHMGSHGHIDMGHVDAGHMHAGDTGHFHGGNSDINHGHSGSDGSGGSNNVLSWFSILLNPLAAVSFLTVFGGMGIMGINYFKWNSIIIFLTALGTGIIVSALLYNFIAKPIYRSENTSNVSRTELVGTAAEVTTDIIANGFGTIKYTVNSIMYTAPARHIEGRAVKQGERVFICKIEDNTFYISEISVN